MSVACRVREGIGACGSLGVFDARGKLEEGLGGVAEWPGSEMELVDLAYGEPCHHSGIRFLTPSGQGGIAECLWLEEDSSRLSVQESSQVSCANSRFYLIPPSLRWLPLNHARLCANERAVYKPIFWVLKDGQAVMQDLAAKLIDKN
eukprot:248757-Hanusia_phi.AAC.2